MPISKVCMPSTSGGTYKIGRGVSRLGGKPLQNEMMGKGFGILLDGGMGGTASYVSLDRYNEATGISPLVREVKGRGLEKLSSKISGLSITQPKKKTQNIKIEL